MTERDAGNNSTTNWVVGIGLAGALFVGAYAYNESLQTEPVPPVGPVDPSAELKAYACHLGSVSVKIDCDRDGILNVADRTPLVADPIDVDHDTIPNQRDPDPYTFNSFNFNANISTFQPNYPVKPRVITPNSPTITVYDPLKDLTRDEDNDNVPDYADQFDGDDYGDADRDFVPNYLDTRPYDPDKDNDGDVDGYDRKPSDPNAGKRAEQKAQEEREQNRKDQAKRDLEAAQRRQEQNRR